MNAREFCLRWNEENRFNKTGPRILGTDDLFSHRHDSPLAYGTLTYIRVNTKTLYTDMRSVWRKLFNETADHASSIKERMALFFSVRAEIFHYGQTMGVWAVMKQSWCWYHPRDDFGIRTEITILTNQDGSSFGIHGCARILSEILNITSVPDRFRIAWRLDEVSAEIEWRRGLHTERSLVVLTAPT